MRIKKCLVFISVLIILTSGCSIQRAQVAANAKISMIGMSKQQVLQCMGVASSIQTEGSIESWKYYSGGDYRGTVNAYTDNQYTSGTVNFQKRSCEINIIFSNNAVTNVMYSGRTGGIITQGEQCAYAVNNCVR